MKLKEVILNVDQLLLDPNNYRLDYGTHSADVDDEEVEALQDETRAKLDKERLDELKESISENGFLEIDRIVVRPFSITRRPKKYVVVEGNRRTAALKSLLDEHVSGETRLPRALISKTKQLSVVCIDAPPDEVREVAAGLMGIRHVSGPKKWTGYQSARLIAELREGGGKSFTEIGSLLGVSAIDAGRRYRGYKAYAQMRSELGSRARTKHYALLLEFLAPRKQGREWLDWDDTKFRFENDATRTRLYHALAPEEGRAEVSNPSDARAFLDHLEVRSHREAIESGTAISDLRDVPDSHDPDRSAVLHRILTSLDIAWDTMTPEERALLERIGERLAEILAGASA